LNLYAYQTATKQIFSPILTFRNKTYDAHHFVIIFRMIHTSIFLLAICASFFIQDATPKHFLIETKGKTNAFPNRLLKIMFCLNLNKN